MYLPEAVPIPWRALVVGERIALRAALWAPAPQEVRLQAAAPAGKLLALGDLMLAGVANAHPRSIFGPIADHLESADLVTANLETPLTSRSEPAGCIGSFMRAAPSAAQALARARIGVVNLANNHALDFGAAGLAETADVLRESGIAACGMRRDGSPAPLFIREVNGLRVGFLGACDDHFVPSASADAPDCGVESDEQLPESVTKARSSVDFLVAHLHCGYEFGLHPLLRQRDRARRLAELGCNLVLCHHAHVPHGIEEWRGAVIAHGLGNAVMPQSAYMRAGHPWTDRSFALDVEFSRAGTSSVRLIPFRIRADGCLGVLPQRCAHDLLAGAARMSRRLGDDRFLRQTGRARAIYEFVQLATAIRDARSDAGAALAERARSLRLSRQRQLMCEIREFEDLAAAAQSLECLAAASEDSRELLQAHSAACRLLEVALARASRGYRWQDAFRSRIP